MTKQQREEFLAGQHIGVVSVGRPDGLPPTTVPTFYAFEPGGTLTMFTNTQGRTTALSEAIKSAGFVTFLVQEETWPAKYVAVEATLDSATRPTIEQMLTITRRYMENLQVLLSRVSLIAFTSAASMPCSVDCAPSARKS